MAKDVPPDASYPVTGRPPESLERVQEKVRAAELLIQGGFGTSVLMTDSGSVKITIEPGWDHPQRKKPEEKPEAGVKHDDGKEPWDLLAFDALSAVVKVLLHGKTKYGARNWEKGIVYSRCYAALMRHLVAWWQREEHDKETRIHHLAHAMCCVMFLLAFELRGMGSMWDDRP